MSIGPDSLWRGCAAAFPQPLNVTDELAAQALVETVYYFNCRILFPPLEDIEYRSSSGEQDILRHVFRWDTRNYEDVFLNGFEARRQANTSDQVFFNIDHFVHHGGRPLDSSRPTTHAFVSTTLNSGWYPTVDAGASIQVYRYEIYAPGGIMVAQTLGTRYQYRSQDEVIFVGGIAPQYIRSAQLFRLSRPTGSMFTNRARVDTRLIVNANHNPQSHPFRLLNIQRPVCVYVENGERRPLESVNWPSGVSEREKREVPTAVSDATSATDWYAGKVFDAESYINAAFRATSTNEAYLFMKNEYLLINYAPGSTNDRVINGPLLICDGFPSLTGTAFGEHGIDCAFGSHLRDEAFIFSGNLCAQINFAPGSTNDYIIRGPTTIAAMFPFFKRTVFESGLDAAFEATARFEAYLFKGDRYALINYGSGSARLIAERPITDGFASLRNTIFESGIDAAFASHRTNEAYLFKNDSYALINFAPGTTNDYIIGGVKNILPNWPSLRPILPRTNRGIDVHIHTNPDPDRDHDEL